MSAPPPVDVLERIVRSLVLYSLAEAQAGHAAAIDVQVSGRSFAVSDDGRGHSPARTAGAAPYVERIYTQLDHPFDDGTGGPVQLQGLGLSLVNALCSELRVTARNAAGSTSLAFRDGRLEMHEPIARDAGKTGNAVSGTIRAELQPRDADVPRVEHWLRALRAAHPSLAIRLNGVDLPPASAQAAP